MDVAEMVLSGLINKRIVRALVNAGIRAAGISGVDDGTIYVERCGIRWATWAASARCRMWTTTCCAR
jgi:acetylglutamate kinase